jgi:DNA-binding SARP family transcriptional activator
MREASGDMVSTLQVRLLGDFTIVHGDTPMSSISAGRLQLLLAYLILNRDTPRSRQQTAFQFWPDSTEAQARTNLRQLVYHLRRALPDAECYVQMDAQTLQWRSDAPCSVDVFDFRRAIQRAEKAEDRGDGRERQAALEEAAALYRGGQAITTQGF